MAEHVRMAYLAYADALTAVEAITNAILHKLRQGEAPSASDMLADQLARQTLNNARDLLRVVAAEDVREPHSEAVRARP